VTDDQRADRKGTSEGSSKDVKTRRIEAVGEAGDGMERKKAGKKKLEEWDFLAAEVDDPENFSPANPGPNSEHRPARDAARSGLAQAGGTGTG
jgi:hypothetical protein